MSSCRACFRRVVFAGVIFSVSFTTQAQTKASPPSASGTRKTKSTTPTDSALDDGAITNGVYRNKTLALGCKIPPGWVLRTDEMNAPDDNNKDENKKEGGSKESKSTPATAASSKGAKVLLAAFSRPPDARAEDVNASIIIAAETAASYPGLQEAAQYFGPLTEVAEANGFTADEAPYDIAIGSKTLVRGDFHKDVGTRVMRQSTLAMLSHGYAISITIIGGTDDEVEDLVDGLTFTAAGK